MKLTCKLLALCLMAAAFCVVAGGQNQRPRLTTDHELKQWFTENRTDFDKLGKIFSISKGADSKADKEFKKADSIDPELLRIVKKLRIIGIATWVDGDVEVGVSKQDRSRAGYLFSPGRKNDVDKAPYVVLESLGDDWYLFRRT